MGNCRTRREIRSCIFFIDLGPLNIYFCLQKMVCVRSKFLLICLLWLAVMPSFAKVHVAVLETVAAGNFVSRDEKIFLTDKLRAKAVEVLPGYKDFAIMTRENIIAFLPPGRALEECVSECIVEMAKNISADYAAQARVGKFGNFLTLTVELYETASGKMLASYTSESENVEQLLIEIENRSSTLFGAIPGAITVNAGGSDYGGGGISGVSMGSRWSSSRVKSVLVEIDSDPDGALITVDGRPQSNCRETPCNVELTEGSHKLTFVQDKYFDADTVIRVDAGVSRIFMRMTPNFGTLVIDPEFPDGLGSKSDLTVQINNEAGELESTLAPGVYRVVLEHACYEDVVFKTSITRGKEFRFDQKLIPKNGHVTIRARQGDTPQRINVYVNGDFAGTTPFDEDVSVCASITVSDDQVSFPYAVLAHQDVEWMYEVPEEEPEQEEDESDSYYSSSSSEYDFPWYNRSSSSRSYSYSANDYDYSQSNNDDDEEPESSTSTAGVGRFFFQGEFGFGGEFLSESGVEDEEILNAFERLSYYDRYSTSASDSTDIVGGYVYLNIFLGLEIGRNFSIGVGGGIGSYFVGALGNDEVDEMLPGGEFAPNVMVEATVGSSWIFGARYRYIFDSRWPSSRVSGLVEMLGVFGMELGGAITDGLGTNFFFSIYIKIPTRVDLSSKSKK